MINLKSTFDVSAIKQRLKAKEEALYQAIEDELRMTGVNFVAYARGLDTYKDRTRNLRGSVGYVLYKNGRMIDSSFPGANDGSKTGLKVAKAKAGIAGKGSKGYTLVVVAGMHYAVYVEAKGYDVLTGGSIEAENEIKRRMERLQKIMKW